MKSTHKKVDVKLIIEKINSTATDYQINELGELTLTFIRGSVNETTPSFLLNSEINQTYNFISTFILRNAKDRQYKEKDLQFIIKTSKKKEVLKTTVNLSEFINSNEVNHIINFNYKGIGIQLLYSVFFGGKSHHVVTQSIQTPQKRPLTANANEYKQTSACQSLNPSSYTKQTTASSQLSGVSGRNGARTPREMTPYQNNQKSKGSGSHTDSSKMSRRRLQMSAVYTADGDGLKEQLPPELQKFIDDLSRATALMEFDTLNKDTVDRKMNTLMTELIVKVLMEKKAFETNETLLEETNNCLLEVIKTHLKQKKETIYLYSTMTKIILLLKKENEIKQNQHINNFIKVLFESIILLYDKIFEFIHKEMKGIMTNIMRKKLMDCNELISYIESLRELFDITRVNTSFTTAFVFDLIREINILFISEVIDPHSNNCTLEIGMNSIMIISFLEDYFRRKHSFNMEKRDQFVVIAETSRVLLLNDKKILVDDEARNNICPHLSLAKISVLLENLNVKNNEDENSIKQTISDMTAHEFESAKYDYSTPSMSSKQIREIVKTITDWNFIPFDIMSVPTFASRVYFEK